MTINWKSGVNGLFETAADWSGGAVPGMADDAVIAASGTYAVTMDQSEAVNSLHLAAAGATFAEGGAGVTLTVATSLAVTAGTLSLTADNSSSIASISGGTLSTGAAGVLSVNLGAPSSTAEYFFVESAVSLSGTTIITDANLVLDGGGALGGSFRGTGELDLTSHTCTAQASIFSGLRALNINGGTLSLAASSGVLAPYLIMTNTGVLDLPDSTAITLTAATIGEGALFETAGNQISGPGTLVTTGNTSSTGFGVSDAGNQGDQLIIGGGITWLNQGTVTDDGIIAMNTSSADTVTILNAAGATFDFEGLHAGLIDHGSTGADIISNLGTLEKTTGATQGDGDHIVTVAAAVINSGLMDIQAGTLALTGGGAIGGTLSGAGTLLLYSGSYTVSGLTGTGHLSVGAGAAVTYEGGSIGSTFTLDNNQTLAIASGTTQTLSGTFIVGDTSGGGTITGPGTLVTSGATTINDLSGAQALALGGTLDWTNSGTVSQAGLVASSHAAINNTGVFDFTSDDASLTAAGSSDTFLNTGTLGKTAGTGTSFINDVLTSTGTINVATGGLVLAQGGAISGILSGAGALHLSNGSFTTTGLSGSGTLHVDNLPGVGYGTLTTSTSATAVVGNAVYLDGNATISAGAGKTLVIGGRFAVNTVESTPSPDGGSLTGPGTITTINATTIGTVTNGYNYPAIALSGGVTWINGIGGSVIDSGAGTSVGGTIDNAGTFYFATDAAGFVATTPGDLFINTGVLGKSGGTGVSLVTDVVTSTGIINVTSGALAFGGGGSVSGSLYGGGALHLSNGSFTTAGISGTGNLVIDNLVGAGYGTLTAIATSTITAGLRLDGNATLGAGAGVNLTLAGNVAINTVESLPSPDGGTLAGPGTLTTLGATTIGAVTNGYSYPAVALNSGITWINAASGTVSDGGRGISNSGTISNAGVFDFTSDTGGIAATSAANIFLNTGTLGKTGGTGVSLVTDVVTSTGTIAVATGALTLGGGGSVSGVLSGAGALHLTNGNFTTAGISGNGSLVIDNLVGAGYGTLTASATSTITTSVRVDGNATLGAEKGVSLTLAGPLAINTVESTPAPDGGTLAGPGTLTTLGATTIGAVTNGYSYPAVALNSGITWINAASGTVSDGGRGISNSGTISNAGVFDFTSDTGGIAATSAANIFLNTGTLGKTGGTGVSLVTDMVTSTGIINVTSGALAFGGGGSVSGSLYGGGALHLSNGSFTTAGISGNGNLVIDNLVGAGYGTLTASATATITTSVRVDGNATLGAAKGVSLTLAGPLAINTVESTPAPDGGTLAGPGTLTTLGVTTIGTVTNGYSYPAIALSGGITWINAASGTVSDGGRGTSSNATISNAGIFDFTTDTGGIAAASTADIFLNTGTLGKTGGTGVSLVTDVVTSTGTINVATGALTLGGGGSVSGVLSGAGALHLSNGNFTTAGISGNGNLVIDNLVGAGYGTLTASATATIATSLRMDGNATLDVAAGKTLTLLNQFAVNTVESLPAPDGGSFTGPGALTTDNLTTIGAVTNGYSYPALALSGGLTWTNPGTVHDAGMITSNNATIVNGGSFDVIADTGGIAGASAADRFFNSGTLAKTGGTGTSTIADTLTNTFLIDAASGTLAITGAIAGTGAMHIDAGATLDIATIFASQSVTFTGGAGATLRLESPASATFTGFAAGDRLDLAGTPVSAASISGTTLTLTTAAGVFTYISAGLAGDVAAVTADAASGSFVSIYRAATATHAPEPLAFGNHHVGDTTTNKLALTISNTDVADGYSERLNASLGGATAGFTAAGSANAIVAGASNSTSLTVTLDTSAAGAKTGTAHLVLATSGAGVDGRGSTPLPGQTVNLTGAVYAYAAANLASTSITLGNQHVGATAHGALALTNGAAAGGYSEGLDASFIGGSANATGTGTATLIAAGATNATSLALGLSAGAAGVASGTETLTLVSDGAGTSGLGTTALGIQSVSLSGTFFNLAAGRLASTTLSLGIIHAGTAAGGALSLTNSAANDGYSESLDAGLSGASAGLSAAGSITGLTAGATDAASLLLTVDTAATGAYSGMATLSLVSDGAGTSGLGTTSLGTQTVTVTATVDNYAVAAFVDPGGPAITGTSTHATINLGSALQGSAALALHFGAENAATGTADLLTGTISSAGAAGFTNSGFGSIGAALSAGQSESGQTVTLATTAAGIFTETVLLSATGTNASFYSGALGTETLTITGTITPSAFTTYTLALGPNTISGANGKGDVFIAAAGALNSRDFLTGGNGANSITLAGAGLFDVNAPALLANIPTISAHEGQAASGTHGNTTQTVLLRDGAAQTLNVAAGAPAAGNANAETIAIYGGNGTDTIKLAAGADHVILGTGTDSITLGGAANTVAAGGGIATIHATAALAAASVVGTTTGSTTLVVGTGGAVNLNTADTHLTVQLSFASQLRLGAMSFITAIGSAGADTIIAGGAGQTLTGGLGTDTLMGAAAGGDLFADTAAGLNKDTIGNWTTGDQIDIRDIAGATATYQAGVLTIAGGGASAAVTISGSFSQNNFVVVGSDGSGGTLIAFHG